MKKEYSCLEKRIIAFYYTIMPKCKPLENIICSNEEQINLYDLIYRIYQEIYNDPLLLFTKINQDDAFNSVFTYVGHPNKELAPLMQKEIKAIDELLEVIMNIGKTGIIDNDGKTISFDGKLKARHKNIFCRAGLLIEKNSICFNKPLFKALKWFSSIKDMTVRRFGYCGFDENYDYVKDILVPLLEKENGAVDIIISWLLKNGYKPVNYLYNQFKVDYIKNINGKEQKIGLACMGDHNHLGFCMEYRYMAYIPYYCSIRILNMKNILQEFDSFSKEIQEFIIRHNKVCDNCGYCIQMDKTKTKPKGHVLVRYNDIDYCLCPMYQGFNYSFRNLTKEDSINIVSFLELLEKYNLIK